VNLRFSNNRHLASKDKGVGMSSRQSVPSSLDACGPTIPRRRWLTGGLGGNLYLIVTLGGLIIVFSTLSPYFFQFDNMMNIARSVSINGMTAAGETMVLISGGLDLSVASVMAASGMVTSSLIMNAGWAIAPARLAGVAFGLLIGLINGLIVTKGRINPLITTLATGFIIRGLGYIASNGQTLGVIKPGYTEMGRDRLFDAVPYPVIGLLLTYAVVYFIMRYTKLGNYIYAIGGNANACRVSGINVDHWRLVIYMLCGAIAGFAGVVLSSLTGSGIPNVAIGSELVIIAGAILGGVSLSGGRGRVEGTLLGVLILGTLTNGLIMLNVQSYWQTVAQGGVLLAAVLIDAWRTGGYR
jgi:ribose transport system permease protein